MVNLFEHNTKKTDAATEAAVPTDEPQPTEVAQATPVAATSPPEPATHQPAGTTFWSYASTDELIRVDEQWQDGALVVSAELPGVVVRVHPEPEDV